MRPFEHLNASSTKDAVRLLSEKKGKARVIAGGTDLLSTLKGEVHEDYPVRVINLKTIPNLDAIRLDGNTLHLGALARLKTIAGSEVVQNKCPALAKAAGAVASPQIRNMGTLGGNLCQEVRCWYYRASPQLGGRYDCLRKGGSTCSAPELDNRYHAIMKSDGCYAVCPSDTAVALTALDAKLVLEGSNGIRVLPVQEFYSGFGNELGADEILVEVVIPIPPAGSKQVFLKTRERMAIDFAIVSVATVVTPGGEARIAIGAVSPRPIRATEAEAVLQKSLVGGKKLEPALAQRASELAVAGAQPLSGNEYKIQIAKTLVKRALLA